MPAKTKKQSAKRILSVTVRKMIDESPDASWLGKYSASAETDYAIDRKHSTDCDSQTYNQNGKAWLERVITRVEAFPATTESETDDQTETVQFLQDLIDDDCTCNESSDWSNREFRYFNPPAENYKGEPHADIVTYCLQDYARMESLNRGDWCFIGVRAEADVELIDGGSIQTITSGGLWGVESDGKDIAETASEELSELKTELRAIGFGTRAISKAFQNVTEKDN